MRYLNNIKWQQHDGTPMLLSDEEQGIQEHHALVSEVLALVLRIYDENHPRFVRDGKLLSPTETEAFLRVFSVLQGAREVIAMETADHLLLLKLVGWAVPTSPVWKETPGLIALLQSAATVPPLPVQVAEHKTVEG